MTSGLGKVSVIVPLYNAKKHIEKCIESILGQTYTDLEIIIINDGSTDGSGNIIEERYLSDERVIYIEQQNGGIAAARNRGIEASSGDFITFMDNDDVIKPEMHKHMVEVITETQADIAICDFNLTYDDGRKMQANYSKTKNEVLDMQSDGVHTYFAKCLINPRSNNYIWTRMYRADIIKKAGIRFEKVMIGEDTLFNFKLLVHVKKITFVQQAFYSYLQHTKSSLHTTAKCFPIAKGYADYFDLLADYYAKENAEHLIEYLPVIAFTRMRSTFFYSRVAGICDDEIMQSIIKNFANRQIMQYLTGFHPINKT